MGLKSYLKENWGAPFVVGFMLLLIASAVQLSIGLSDAANGTAVYAFYLLVLGVALQIASYVKYGESESEPERLPSPRPPFRWPSVRRPSGRTLALAGVLTAFVVGGVAATVLYYPATAPPSTEYIPSGTSTVTVVVSHHCLGCNPLTVHETFANSAQGPAGTVVEFEVVASGGSSPYFYTATWADGVVQSSSDGVFGRTFSANQTAVYAATVVVKSADGQTATLNVTAAPPT